MFPFKRKGVTYDRCTDFFSFSSFLSVENKNKTIKLLLQHLVFQCATELDEERVWVVMGERKVKYDNYKHGACGPDCPGEDDHAWLTDDNLEVTHHQKFKDEENSLDNSDLPDTLLVSSTSSAAETWPSLMGVYSITNKTYSGRPVWRHIVRSYQLYYSGN